MGVSPDSPAAQKKFDDKNGFVFFLLCDGDHEFGKADGAWAQKAMYGKRLDGIIRSSFLIDEKGKIIARWYKIGPQATLPEALKVLEPC